MIYECPNCRTPQEAGQTICPHCFAEFDGPVPSDAVVPALPEAAAEAASNAEAAPSTSTPQAEPVSAAEMEALRPQAEPVTEAPPLTEVPPPASTPPAAFAAPASSSGPYLTAPANPAVPSVSPLPYSPPDSDTEPMNPAFSKLSRALLVAFPIILVLVLGCVFYANSLNAGSDTVPVTPPPVQASVPLPPVSAPTGTPTVLQGTGSTNDAANDTRAKMLTGRWVAASGDFYVFSSDGTGSRGNPNKQQKEQTFLWGLIQNRVMLYMDKNELLRFSVGPDDNTIFLAPQAGRYVQYSRAKT